MKYILLSLAIIFGIDILCLAQDKTTTDPLIETNLTDNLKTRVRFKKSKNIDVDRLTRLSRITDLHKRRRLRMNKSMMTRDMSVKEVLDAKILNINDIQLVSTKYGLLNPYVSTNIYITKLAPLTYPLKSDLDVISYINSIKQINNIDYFNISKMTVNSYELYDSQDIELNLDSTAYLIDNSVFDVIITQKILAELENDTKIYKFESSGIFGAVHLADLKRLPVEEYHKWISVFYQNQTADIEYLKNPKTPKILAEAHIEDGVYDEYDMMNLSKNLSILKKLKYDTVLVRFHGDSDIEKTCKLISDIKSAGFNVYTVYVGLDGRNPIWNPFIAPEKLESLISVLAPLSDGWLLNWRSTSSHVKILPKEFFNFMCNNVRKYNKNCYIYGEVFYGGIDPLGGIQALMTTIPDNITGIIVNNFGYYGYNHAFIINRFLSNKVEKYRKLQKIAQVIGYKPYYCSKNNMNLSITDEYKYKESVEKSFNRVRCGTITLLHDGVDDHLAGEYNNYDTIDNIVYDVKIQEL